MNGNDNGGGGGGWYQPLFDIIERFVVSRMQDFFYTLLGDIPEKENDFLRIDCITIHSSNPRDDKTDVSGVAPCADILNVHPFNQPDFR